MKFANYLSGFYHECVTVDSERRTIKGIRGVSYLVAYDIKFSLKLIEPCEGHSPTMKPIQARYYPVLYTMPGGVSQAEIFP